MHVPDLPIASQRMDDVVRLDASAIEGRFDAVSTFGRAAPLELEIGTGKGRFLLLAASAKPECDFLGIEYVRSYAETAIERLGKRALTNVRVVHAEAVSFLKERLEDASVSALHIYFPDPWPKQRHRKRRFIRPEVLDELARLLVDRGLLRFVSDHAEYASSARALLTQHPAFTSAGSGAEFWSLPGMADFTTAGVTNFEIKYRRQGRPLHRFAFARIERARGATASEAAPPAP